MMTTDLDMMTHRKRLSLITQIWALLRACQIQRSPNDDSIIANHIDDACGFAKLLMDEELER